MATEQKRRLFGSRIPYAVLSAAHVPLGLVLGCQYYDMGLDLGLSCRMHNLCWTIRRPDTAWCF